MRSSRRPVSHGCTSRSRGGITALFGDAELVEPGLVDIVDRRPDSVGGEPSGVYGAVGFLL